MIEQAIDRRHRLNDFPIYLAFYKQPPRQNTVDDGIAEARYSVLRLGEADKTEGNMGCRTERERHVGAVQFRDYSGHVGPTGVR